MLWLHSNEEYDCIAKFDPKYGLIEKHSMRALGANAPTATDGWYSELESGLLALYRFDDMIYFYIFGHIFQLDNQTRITVSGPRKQRFLKVLRAGQELFSTSYVPAGPGPPPNDPMPFVEDSDFDFGLFVSDISRSPQRKNVLLGKE